MLHRIKWDDEKKKDDGKIHLILLIEKENVIIVWRFFHETCLKHLPLVCRD